MTLLAIAIFALAAVEFFGYIHLGGKLTTTAQAITDLTSFISSLSQAVSGASGELSVILNKISQANDAGNAELIEAQVAAGQKLVESLNAAVATADAIANPPSSSSSVEPSSSTSSEPSSSTSGEPSSSSSAENESSSSSGDGQ